MATPALAPQRSLPPPFWCASSDDGGEVPSSVEARRAPLRAVDELEGGAAGGERVLVVDDESSIRLIVDVNLAAAGMEVLEAPNGRVALELVRANRPDLVLLDVMMPGLDGWEVARELAADPETRELPVVFLTARADPAGRRRAHELGAVGYLVKPFDPLGLAAELREVMARVGRGERAELCREILDRS